MKVLSFHSVIPKIGRLPGGICDWSLVVKYSRGKFALPRNPARRAA
jgi:hypothetical protein